MHARTLIQIAIVGVVGFLPQVLFAEEDKADAKGPEKVFEKLDRNGNGKLTADEVSAEQKRFFEHLLRVADKDKNGELTKAEFLEGFKPDDLKVPVPNVPGGFGEQRQFDPRRMFERLDQNKDGKLTLEELPEPMRDRIKPFFERLGKTEINVDEFARFAERMQGGGFGGGLGGPERMPAFIRKLDKNGDGKLSKEELLNAAEIFDELDADKDGLLDFRELMGFPGRPDGTPPGAGNRPDAPAPSAAAAKPEQPATAAGAKPQVKPDPTAAGAKKNRKRPGEKGAGPLRRFDTNGDGKISKDESQGKLKENFDKLDTNGDGFLDPQELKKALEDLAPRKKPGTGPKA